MIKPVTIIKVMHSDKVGFHLIPVLHAGRVTVFAATKSNTPLVVVEGFGDFRSEVIPVTGDVTIMNPDGLVLSEVSYEKLMAPVRIEEQTEAVLQPIREAMSGDRPIDWEELNKRSEIPSVFPPLNPGGSVQGSDPATVWNSAKDLRAASPTLYLGLGKLQFLPSNSLDQLNELISADHVDPFTQMFQWMIDLPPNGPWILYVNPHFDKTLGIMECASQPHIVVTELGCRTVDTLSAKEKESHGLEYIPDKGWRVDSLLNKQAFTVNLDNEVFDIRPVTFS